MNCLSLVLLTEGLHVCNLIFDSARIHPENAKSLPSCPIGSFRIKVAPGTLTPVFDSVRALPIVETRWAAVNAKRNK